MRARLIEIACDPSFVWPQACLRYAGSCNLASRSGVALASVLKTGNFHFNDGPR